MRHSERGGEWWRLDNLSEEEWEREGGAMHHVMHSIAEAPARTAEGKRAKARVILAYGAVEDEGTSNDMVRSLIRDVLAEQPA